jgi:methylated-DNA-[protein]-cysteine S-methyltransferase
MGRKARFYTIFETEGGFCGIAWNDAGIVRFQLPSSVEAATERNLLKHLSGAVRAEPAPAIAATIDAVRRYFSGEEVDFSDVALDLEGQEGFFREIYEKTRQVGWGRTTTYGALAKELGAGPEAARDVGIAMARNPVALIIPCHRVLAAGGRIGGFSAPGGSGSKARMLELEGVRLASNEPAQEPAQQAFGF